MGEQRQNGLVIGEWMIYGLVKGVLLHDGLVRANCCCC